MLSAIQNNFDLSSRHANVFSPVFNCIGERLDAAICQPDLDSLFAGDGRKIIVAISDASWTDATVVRAYGEHEVGPICAAAEKALSATIRDCKLMGSNVSHENVISLVWFGWSDMAYARIRENNRYSEIVPDLPVGTLFSHSFLIRRQLDAIAVAGGTPVLAIALSSIGSTTQHPKCRVRTAVITLPEWACASGAVAGHG